MKKTKDGDAFSEVKHKHDDPVASLYNAHVYYIYYNTINKKLP